MPQVLLTFERYAELAMRTAKWGDEHFNLNHVVQGFAGELGELIETVDKIPIAFPKLLEEVGDFWWYYVYACRAIGIPGNTTSYKGLDLHVVVSLEDDPSRPNRNKFLRYDAVYLLPLTVGNVADTVKRYVTYGGETLDLRRMIQCLDEIKHHIMNIECYAGFLTPVVWAANIAKLEKRYPQKFFESDRALVRDVLAEQKVLEGHLM